MTRAETVVATLLGEDIVRVCAWCEKEFGVTNSQAATHGFCKRHYIEMAKQHLSDMIKAGNTTGAASASRVVRQAMQQPDSDFAPDLAQQQQSTPPKASFWPTM